MVLHLRPTVVIKKLHFQYRLERPAIYLQSPAPLRRRHLSSKGASGSATPPRKQITVLSDDGRVQWQDLTRLEKVARTTQQTFNVGLVLGGFFLTGTVIYLLYSEVFSADSKTRHFNRAVDQIRRDARALELLGSEQKVRAFGEPTFNKWARARPIASTLRKDRAGAEHLLMHFNVEGSLRSGVVNLHMIKRPEQTEFEYRYLALNVKGHPVLYLENADAKKETPRAGFSLFGARWR